MQMEIEEALERRKPIVLLQQTSALHGMASSDAELCAHVDEKTANKAVALLRRVRASQPAPVTVPWVSEQEYRAVSIARFLEAVGLQEPSSSDAGAAAGASSPGAALAHTLRRLSMGCSAPELPPREPPLLWHVCIVHDGAASGQACSDIKAALEAAFGAKVFVGSGDALLQAAGAAARVLLYLTRGMFADGADAHLAR